MRSFLKKQDVNVIEINLANNKLALEACNTATDDNSLLRRISLLEDKKLIENNTVIFIDEIQEADDAITPIKFLVQNKKYKFIFSGSLLGIKMSNIMSVPVGFLKIIQMYPMDFEEFIKAI